MSPQQPSFQLRNCPYDPPPSISTIPSLLHSTQTPLSLTLCSSSPLGIPIRVMPEHRVGLLAGGSHPWHRELPAGLSSPGKNCVLSFSAIPLVTPSPSPSPSPSCNTHRVSSMPDTALGPGETGINKTDLAMTFRQFCSIHLFMQQTLIEYLLCARHCS